MLPSRSSSSPYRTGYKVILVVIIAWTVSVGGSLIWNVYSERHLTMDVAKNEALANFNKDLAFRSWASKHGGVYVPPTEDTPPNPYLTHIPDRDLNLPSGKKLTLMNPAYMMRQVLEDYEKLSGIKGHIMSLKPLNPINMPDAWERKALQDFERGVTEVTETAVIDGKPCLRLIRPLVVQKGCLKCHAQQGYKEGDIRGGIGISLPLETLLAGQRKVVKNMLLTHGFIWLMGMGGIVFIMYKVNKNIIEREKAAGEIAEREKRFRNLVETTSDLVWEVDTTGAYTYVSPRIREMLGYGPGELLGKTPFDLMAPEESKRVSDIFRTLVVSRQPFIALENTNLAKDGSRVVIETSGVPVFDKNGAFQGYRGIDRDITERKRAEEERFASETRFRAVFERSVDAIGVSKTGTHVFVNPAYLNLFGYTSNDELRDKPILDLIAPEEHLKILELVKRRARGEAVPSVYETRGRKKDGSTFDMDVHASTYELSGEVYTLVILRDITERNRMEEALRKSNAVLENIFSTTTTSIAYMDRDFNFIRVNGKYAEEAGKPPGFFPGKNHFDLYPYEENKVLFRRVVDTGKQCIALAKPFEYKDQPERGITHWDWSLTPVIRPDGMVESVILSLINVTERIKAQEELRNLNEELEQRVQTRTSELAEKNKELERLNKLFVGRELRMAELKERIRELEIKAEEKGDQRAQQ